MCAFHIYIYIYTDTPQIEEMKKMKGEKLPYTPPKEQQNLFLLNDMYSLAIFGCSVYTVITPKERPKKYIKKNYFPKGQKMKYIYIYINMYTTIEHPQRRRKKNKRTGNKITHTHPYINIYLCMCLCSVSMLRVRFLFPRQFYVWCVGCATWDLENFNGDRKMLFVIVILSRCEEEGKKKKKIGQLILLIGEDEAFPVIFSILDQNKRPFIVPPY